MGNIIACSTPQSTNPREEFDLLSQDYHLLCTHLEFFSSRTGVNVKQVMQKIHTFFSKYSVRRYNKYHSCFPENITHLANILFSYHNQSCIKQVLTKYHDILNSMLSDDVTLLTFHHIFQMDQITPFVIDIVLKLIHIKSHGKSYRFTSGSHHNQSPDAKFNENMSYLLSIQPQIDQNTKNRWKPSTLQSTTFPSLPPPTTLTQQQKDYYTWLSADINNDPRSKNFYLSVLNLSILAIGPTNVTPHRIYLALAIYQYLNNAQRNNIQVLLDDETKQRVDWNPSNLPTLFPHLFRIFHLKQHDTPLFREIIRLFIIPPSYIAPMRRTKPQQQQHLTGPNSPSSNNQQNNKKYTDQMNTSGSGGQNSENTSDSDDHSDFSLDYSNNNNNNDSEMNNIGTHQTTPTQIIPTPSPNTIGINNTTTTTTNNNNNNTSPAQSIISTQPYVKIPSNFKELLGLKPYLKSLPIFQFPLTQPDNSSYISVSGDTTKVNFLTNVHRSPLHHFLTQPLLQQVNTALTQQHQLLQHISQVNKLSNADKLVVEHSRLGRPEHSRNSPPQENKRDQSKSKSRLGRPKGDDQQQTGAATNIKIVGDQSTRPELIQTHSRSHLTQTHTTNLNTNSTLPTHSLSIELTTPSNSTPLPDPRVGSDGYFAESNPIDNNNNQIHGHNITGGGSGGGIKPSRRQLPKKYLEAELASQLIVYDPTKGVQSSILTYDLFLYLIELTVLQYIYFNHTHSHLPYHTHRARCLKQIRTTLLLKMNQSAAQGANQPPNQAPHGTIQAPVGAVGAIPSTTTTTSQQQVTHNLTQQQQQIHQCTRHYITVVEAMCNPLNPAQLITIEKLRIFLWFVQEEDVPILHNCTATAFYNNNKDVNIRLINNTISKVFKMTPFPFLFLIRFGYALYSSLSPFEPSIFLYMKDYTMNITKSAQLSPIRRPAMKDTSQLGIQLSFQQSILNSEDHQAGVIHPYLTIDEEAEAMVDRGGPGGSSPILTTLPISSPYDERIYTNPYHSFCLTNVDRKLIGLPIPRSHTATSTPHRPDHNHHHHHHHHSIPAEPFLTNADLWFISRQYRYFDHSFLYRTFNPVSLCSSPLSNATLHFLTTMLTVGMAQYYVSYDHVRSSTQWPFHPFLREYHTYMQFEFQTMFPLEMYTIQYDLSAHELTCLNSTLSMTILQGQAPTNMIDLVTKSNNIFPFLPTINPFHETTSLSANIISQFQSFTYPHITRSLPLDSYQSINHPIATNLLGQLSPTSLQLQTNQHFATPPNITTITPTTTTSLNLNFPYGPGRSTPSNSFQHQSGLITPLVPLYCSGNPITIELNSTYIPYLRTVQDFLAQVLTQYSRRYQSTTSRLFPLANLLFLPSGGGPNATLHSSPFNGSVSDIKFYNLLAVIPSETLQFVYSHHDCINNPQRTTSAQLPQTSPGDSNTPFSRHNPYIFPIKPYNTFEAFDLSPTGLSHPSPPPTGGQNSSTTIRRGSVGGVGGTGGPYNISLVASPTSNIVPPSFTPAQRHFLFLRQHLYNTTYSLTLQDPGSLQSYDNIIDTYTYLQPLQKQLHLHTLLFSTLLSTGLVWTLFYQTHQTVSHIKSLYDQPNNPLKPALSTSTNPHSLAWLLLINYHTLYYNNLHQQLIRGLNLCWNGGDCVEIPMALVQNGYEVTNTTTTTTTTMATTILNRPQHGPTGAHLLPQNVIINSPSQYGVTSGRRGSVDINPDTNLSSHHHHRRNPSQNSNVLPSSSYPQLSPNACNTTIICTNNGGSNPVISLPSHYDIPTTRQLTPVFTQPQALARMIEGYLTHLPPLLPNTFAPTLVSALFKISEHAILRVQHRVQEYKILREQYQNEIANSLISYQSTHTTSNTTQFNRTNFPTRGNPVTGQGNNDEWTHFTELIKPLSIVRLTTFEYFSIILCFGYSCYTDEFCFDANTTRYIYSPPNQPLYYNPLPCQINGKDMNITTGESYNNNTTTTNNNNNTNKDQNLQLRSQSILSQQLYEQQQKNDLDWNQKQLAQPGSELKNAEYYADIKILQELCPNISNSLDIVVNYHVLHAICQTPSDQRTAITHQWHNYNLTQFLYKMYELSLQTQPKLKEFIKNNCCLIDQTPITGQDFDLKKIQNTSTPGFPSSTTSLFTSVDIGPVPQIPDRLSQDNNIATTSTTSTTSNTQPDDLPRSNYIVRQYPDLAECLLGIDNSIITPEISSLYTMKHHELHANRHIHRGTQHTSRQLTLRPNIDPDIKDSSVNTSLNSSSGSPAPTTATTTTTSTINTQFDSNPAQTLGGKLPTILSSGDFNSSNSALIGGDSVESTTTNITQRADGPIQNDNSLVSTEPLDCPDPIQPCHEIAQASSPKERTVQFVDQQQPQQQQPQQLQSGEYFLDSNYSLGLIMFALEACIRPTYLDLMPLIKGLTYTPSTQMGTPGVVSNISNLNTTPVNLRLSITNIAESNREQWDTLFAPSPRGNNTDMANPSPKHSNPPTTTAAAAAAQPMGTIVLCAPSKRLGEKVSEHILSLLNDPAINPYTQPNIPTNPQPVLLPSSLNPRLNDDAPTTSIKAPNCIANNNLYLSPLSLPAPGSGNHILSTDLVDVSSPTNNSTLIIPSAPNNSQQPQQPLIAAVYSEILTGRTATSRSNRSLTLTIPNVKTPTAPSTPSATQGNTTSSNSINHNRDQDNEQYPQKDPNIPGNTNINPKLQSSVKNWLGGGCDMVDNVQKSKQNNNDDNNHKSKNRQFSDNPDQPAANTTPSKVLDTSSGANTPLKSSDVGTEPSPFNLTLHIGSPPVIQPQSQASSQSTTTAPTTSTTTCTQHPSLERRRICLSQPLYTTSAPVTNQTTYNMYLLIRSIIRRAPEPILLAFLETIPVDTIVNYRIDFGGRMQGLALWDLIDIAMSFSYAPRFVQKMENLTIDKIHRK